MKYFAQIDAWLDAVLLNGEEGESHEAWFERVKSAVKEKLLDSYRNGQKAGLPPSESETEAAPRRRWPPRKP
jgi:hypothetical protein